MLRPQFKGVYRNEPQHIAYNNIRWDSFKYQNALN